MRRRHDDLSGPLVCVCDIPRPDRNDECSTCRRVIAELVRRRRIHTVREAS